jgi:hypothetical protein
MPQHCIHIHICGENERERWRERASDRERKKLQHHARKEAVCCRVLLQSDRERKKLQHHVRKEAVCCRVLLQSVVAE